MFYVYLLENERGELYTGYSTDLKRRLLEHNHGRNTSTKNRMWKCIYYEGCIAEEDARRRERYFKTTDGRRALKIRLRSFFYQRRQPKSH